MEAKKQGTVRTADSELYYEIYGSGRPLILLHGEWTSRLIWEPQIEALSDKYQVIAVDLRGHGKATLGELPYSHVDDITTLMDRLGLESAGMVGHQLGGSVARAMGIERPQRVEALVIAATGSQGMFGIPIPEEEAELLAAPMVAVRDGQMETAVDLHETIWVDGVDHEAAPEVREKIRESVAAESFADLVGGAPEIRWSTHKMPELHHVTGPTLLIWGQHDQPLIERSSIMSADILPDVHTAVIANAAHYPNWEQPEQFNKEILAFLNTL